MAESCFRVRGSQLHINMDTPVSLNPKVMRCLIVSGQHARVQSLEKSATADAPLLWQSLTAMAGVVWAHASAMELEPNCLLMELEPDPECKSYWPPVRAQLRTLCWFEEACKRSQTVETQPFPQR